jgi:hypothetical protein
MVRRTAASSEARLDGAKSGSAPGCTFTVANGSTATGSRVGLASYIFELSGMNVSWRVIYDALA